MHKVLFPRLPIVSRLLGVVGIFAVCYFVLDLCHPRAVWESRYHFADARLISPLRSAFKQSSPITTGIPEILWYKIGPKGINDQLRRYIDACITQNPTFQYEFLTDDSGDQFVRDHFATRPDILDGFLAVNIPIIKADLLRYLVLYTYGGVWNDLDVSCQAPISEWVPEQYKANASIVVGMEFDVDIWIRQFASWTIMAKPESPHLLMVVEDCLEGLYSKAKELNVEIQDLRSNMIDDIVDVSGPRRLTRGIQKSLSKIMDREIGNDDLAHLSQPKLIGDVLVLPDYAFADTMNQQYGDKKTGKILVTHHYAGSWKNENGGEEIDVT
ncbi:hypothetical protein N0V93_009822 [Gnomoniopsis smithogilvyi]|uniref:Initiation-specific alpha-1,6-mannosyltransferase n=1 Tax=Gnomoniopsis smithogilvyi TaxID=1191159 RepID=A0A9W8YJ60_9PEZI|nr:hypothetical protein N0V93_009822 [Gnomoniopsis smithogilvyi]